MENFHLNTTGHCVFCLKKENENTQNQGNNDGHQDQNHPGFHQLNKLCFHMKVFSKLSNNLTLPNSVLSGLLCSNCSELYLKLMKLFVLLEKTRLELEFTMTTLCGVMEETNQNSSMMDNFKESMQKEDDSKVHLEVMEELRTVILEKCKEQTKLLNPELRLGRERDCETPITDDDQYQLPPPVECELLELTTPLDNIIDKTVSGEFKCADCKKTFSRSYVLEAHRRQVHFKSRKEVCRICQKTFKYKYSLQRHHEVVHLKRRYHCPESRCDKVYTKKNDLRTHMSKCHGVEKEDENKMIPIQEASMLPVQSGTGWQNLNLPHQPYLQNIPTPTTSVGAGMSPYFQHSVTNNWTFTSQQAPSPSNTNAVQNSNSSGGNYLIHADVTANGVRCKQCGKMYRYRVGFTEHFKAVHEGRRFFCGIGQCQKEFVKTTQMKKHRMNCKGMPSNANVFT